MNDARAQAMPSEITVATDNVPDCALEDNPDGSKRVCQTEDGGLMQEKGKNWHDNYKK